MEDNSHIKNISVIKYLIEQALIINRKTNNKATIHYSGHVDWFSIIINYDNAIHADTKIIDARSDETSQTYTNARLILNSIYPRINLTATEKRIADIFVSAICKNAVCNDDIFVDFCGYFKYLKCYSYAGGFSIAKEWDIDEGVSLDVKQLDRVKKIILGVKE